MELKDRIALVTGAASGIGLATSLELARRGCKAVAMVDRSDTLCEAAERAKAEMPEKAFVPFTGDATDETFRKDVFDQIVRSHGTPTICIPAAGLTRDALAVKMDKQTGLANVYPLETFRLVTEVDLIAPIYWALETVAHIAENRFRNKQGKWNPDEGIIGTIIFIGSVSSQGNKGQIAYAAAKAGLEGAAATIAKEAIFHGVRTGVIHPGFTDTPMVRAMGEEHIAQYVLPFTQLGRLIKPEEIADAICFMVSNSAVSGQLWADAGWHPSAA